MRPPASLGSVTSKIAFILVLLASATAVGQSDGATKRAQALQVEGLGLMQKGDNRAALQKFEEAFRLVQSPKILFNRGKAHRALGEDVEALVDFERFLDEAPYAPKESRAEAERAVQALRPRLSYLEIQVDNPGSTISVDGRQVGTAPLLRPVVVAPGTHEVRVTKPGMNDDSRSVAPIAGQKLRVMVYLVAVAAPAPPPTTAPAATAAAAAPAPTPPAVTPASDSPAEPPTTVVTDGSPPASATGGQRWQITAAWITAAAGLAFLGAGITAQVLVDSKTDEFNAVGDEDMPATQCNKQVENYGPAPCKELIEAADLRQKLAIAGFAAAGLSLAGALVFALTAPSSSAGQAATAACAPTPFAGVSCAFTLRF